jgi:hypothetical protein
VWLFLLQLSKEVFSVAVWGNSWIERIVKVVGLFLSLVFAVYLNMTVTISLPAAGIVYSYSLGSLLAGFVGILWLVTSFFCALQKTPYSHLRFDSKMSMDDEGVFYLRVHNDGMGAPEVATKFVQAVDADGKQMLTSPVTLEWENHSAGQKAKILRGIPSRVLVFRGGGATHESFLLDIPSPDGNQITLCLPFLSTSWLCFAAIDDKDHVTRQWFCFEVKNANQGNQIMATAYNCFASIPPASILSQSATQC